MPMVTAARPNAGRYVFGGVALSLALFGALRLSWVEAHLLLPLTRIQGLVAGGLFGMPVLPVQVTLECSGADALALCAGAVLAYPVRWRARLAGVAGGLTLILVLNTLRIGTLGLVVASPARFNALHLYLWPALLMLAIAGYVLGWMRIAERVPVTTAATTPSAVRPTAWQPSRRFALLTAAYLIVFATALPFTLDAPAVVAFAGLITGTAAAVLGSIGMQASAAANVLVTTRGSFIVTHECISTPLIPVYLAAVCAYAANWRRMAAGVLLMVPLFTALGVVRLLMVALPPAVMASPTFLVHAFYQLLLAVVVVVVAARWRHGHGALGHAAAGVAAGVSFGLILGPAYTWMVMPRADLALADPQGAVAFLPAFQVALYLALWVATFANARWLPFTAGLAGLVVAQVVALLALHAPAATDVVVHVRDVRAWAVAGPVLFFVLVVARARPAR